MNTQQTSTRTSGASWLGRMKQWLSMAPSASRPMARRSFAPCLDALEDRTLMAASILNQAGTLYLVGTAGADAALVITQANQVVAAIKAGSAPAVTQRFAADRVNQIVFLGGAGDDKFVNATGIKCLAAGMDGSDVLIGGKAADTLLGGAGNDLIAGGAGNDVIQGNAGHDRLYGEDGADSINGGAGMDAIDGGAGNDKLYGDEDRDFLFGGDGVDLLAGGAGDDILDGGTGIDLFFGQAGRDAFFDDPGQGLVLDPTVEDMAVARHLLPATPTDAVMAYVQFNLILSATPPVTVPAGKDPLAFRWDRYQEDNPGVGHFYVATAKSNISALLGTDQGSIYHWGPNEQGDAAGTSAYLGANATAAGYIRSVDRFGIPAFSAFARSSAGYTPAQLQNALRAVGLA